MNDTRTSIELGCWTIGGSLALFVLFSPVVAYALAPVLYGLESYLFVLPQYMLAFDRVVNEVPGRPDPFLSGWSRAAFAITFWAAVGGGYGLLTRRLRQSLVFALAPAAVLMAAALLHLVFALFGYRLEPDGP